MTCIAAFLRPDHIVFAADSRFIVTEAGGRTHALEACKIRSAGRWRFMVAGLANYPGGTDIFTLVARAIGPTATITAAMAAAYAELATPIALGLQSLHEAGQRPRLEVFVGGVQDDQPVLGYLRAYVKGTDPFEAQCGWGTSLTGLCGADGTISHVASLAAGPALDLMAERPRPPWLDRGDAAAARRLIGLQAAATPELVGGAIDVLEITKAGARWAPQEDGILT